MILKDLLENIYFKSLSSVDGGIMIETISCDSRQKQSQGLFIAINGLTVNGESFIKGAIDQGAVVIAKKGEHRTLSNYTIPDSICVLDVEDPKEFLRLIALRFYDNPSNKVRTIGITGTNGKTTITYFLESIFSAQGQTSAVIGTINYRIAGRISPSKNTTPGLLDNQSFLSRLAGSNIPYCVMEVSSHALQQGRVEGINFAGAIFTNLTQDHLDYHKDMESYFKAKAILFENLSDKSWATINVDDPYGQRILAKTRSRVYTYGIDNQADIKALNINYALNGTRMNIVFPTGEISLQTSFIGKHNVYNILASASAAFAEGIGLENIKKGIEDLTCVPGRLEAVKGSQDFYVFIDYAHTEDGLINVLQALRNVSHNRILLVFGCGGDRDKGKRSKMGQAACKLADFSIITSDNPRSEEPMSIIDQIKIGFTTSNYEIVPDRKEAILKALKMAKTSEIVLIAGKGHEDYQILKNETIPFKEADIVKESLNLITQQWR